MGGKGSGGYHGGGRPRKKVSNVTWLKEHPEDISLDCAVAMLAKRKEKKKKEYKYPDAVDWLKTHPEDIPMAKENLAARDSGYANDDLRQLMAAMCLRACIDYKRATLGERVDHISPEDMMKDCHEFFQGEIFQFFVNRMPVEEIEAMIRATPKNSIHSIWKKKQDTQVPVVVE